jgi:hypothetical protein
MVASELSDLMTGGCLEGAAETDHAAQSGDGRAVTSCSGGERSARQGGGARP